MTGLTADSQTLTALILATFSPFVAFLAIIVLTRSRRRLSAILSIGAISVSLACSLFLLARHWETAAPVQYTARLLASSGIDVPFGFLVDHLSLLMLAIVAVICFLVQVYSLGYMADDPGFSRYYAFMSLFAWAMLSLTVSTRVQAHSARAFHLFEESAAAGAPRQPRQRGRNPTPRTRSHARRARADKVFKTSGIID